MKCYVLCVITFLLAACNTQLNDKPALLKNIPSDIQAPVYFDSVNVFTKAKVTLGRYLFYDNRLSINNTKACASCHDPKFSFTDRYRRSIGAYGDLTQHNAPPLINLIFNQYLTAADSTLHFPGQQIQNPMFHEAPI
ncbi:MAG: cytochrome-c peroxidase [Chitinophagaceae bacterium]|nr:cytochrome-c peroxidase [Chitinophagaceae bacterium]